MNLSRILLGVTFANPTVLAAGPMGIVGSGWAAIVRAGAGGITTKSCWLEAHEGHPTPVAISTPHWTLNAVGLSQGGFDAAKAEIETFRAASKAPLICNIVAESVDHFGETAARYVTLHPDFLEVNISCPNVESDFGKPFSSNAKDAAAVTHAVKAKSGKTPVFVKLSPNVPNIGEIAKACVDSGADGITAINTVGPGLAIDLKSRMPILSNKVGGVSGRGIKPIALKCVADIYAATGGKTPIIGVGGVTTGEDAMEMLLAGASLVGIGTAIAERGLDVFGKVVEEMQAWGDAEGVKDVSELTGAMHRELSSRGSPYA